MATFSDFLKKSKTEETESNTFADYISKNASGREPVVSVSPESEFFRTTGEFVPTTPKPTFEPERVPTSLSEQLRQIATPEVIERGREQERLSKEQEEQRKRNLAGAEERLANLIAESKELEISPEPDFNRQNELTRQIAETRNIITANQPGFKTGLRESIGLEPTAKFGFQQATPERAQAQEEAQEEARQQRGFTTGRVLGEVGKQAALYATIGAALKGTQLGTQIASKLGGGATGQFAANQAIDLLVDTVIQTPQEVLRGESLGEIGMNRLFDVGINLVIGGAIDGPKYIRSLRNADPNALKEAAEQTLKNQPDIVKELGLPEGTTAEQMLKQLESDEFVEQVAKQAQDLRTEDVLKQFESPKFAAREAEQQLVEARKGIEPVAEPKNFNEFIQQSKQAEVPKTEVPTEPIRQEMFPTPEVGTSKSPFTERVRDFLKDDPTTAKIRRELKQLDELPTTSNEARTQAAQQLINDDFDKALNIVKSGDRFDSGIESEMGRMVVDQLQQQGRNAEAVEVISKMSEKFRKAGQDVQAASIWAKTTPEGMQKWAVDTLEKSDVKVDPDLIAKVGDDMRKINEMTPEELAKMVAERTGSDKDTTLKAIQDAFSYEQLKATNTALTMQQVIDKIPVLKARKVSTIQAMSHLLNLRTFNRNILGNTTSIGGEAIAKLPASVADRALSAFTGNRSVVGSMPKFKQALNEGWQQGKRSFFEIKAGVGKGKTGKYEALFGNTFKTKTGKGAEKLLSWSLQTPDEFFKGFTKADSLYNQVKARLGKQVDDWSFEKIMDNATSDEIQTALKEAEFVTFQNDSFLAEVFGKTKKGLNWLSTGAAQRIPGLKGIFTDEFGLGDMVIKYTRVPGNIITRGLEYSPLGYFKGIQGAVNIAKAGDAVPRQVQREVAMQLGRATTGSGLMLAGALLQKAGVISGVEDSSDYDVQAFNKAEGGGDYKINISALNRLIKGQSTEQRQGDKIINYNWLEPIGMPLAVGARVAQSNPDGIMDVRDAVLKATIEEATDLPTMYIVQQMMYESMKEPKDGENKALNVLSLPLKEAIPGFIPSAVRQTAQTIDPVIRETTGGANVPFLEQLTPVLGERVTGKIQANIPQLSKALPPKLDPIGREQRRTEGVVPNILSPATVTTIQPIEYGEQLRQISEITDRTDMFPDRKAPNSTTFRNEKFTLTPEEKVRWQQVEGQKVNELYQQLFSEVTVTEENANAIADALKRIKGQASNFAKEDMLTRRGE
jgi:hypothetical protein